MATQAGRILQRQLVRIRVESVNTRVESDFARSDRCLQFAGWRALVGRRRPRRHLGNEPWSANAPLIRGRDALFITLRSQVPTRDWR